MLDLFSFYHVNIIFIPYFVGVIFDGVILEGTFNSDNNANLAKKDGSARQEMQFHPFSWVMLFKYLS